MDKQEAWDWVANNRGCIANAVRHHKLARWFDSFEDAFQEATIRIAACLAKYYDPAQRFDMLYAKLVADETWTQIASAYGYGGKQGRCFRYQRNWKT